jgi:hypothetical protein
MATSIRHGIRVFVALAATAMLAACGANPVRQANTLQQHAYAAYGTFVITEESAVRLTAPGSSLPASAQLAIISGVERAQPVVDTGRDIIAQYEQARADFEAAKIDANAFQVVVDKLGGWVVEAERVVADLLAATRRRQ